MAQIFHPSTNTISKFSIFGALVAVGGLLWLTLFMNRSFYATEVNVPREQPVPFSHKHHVSGLGIDCRHCHTSVEDAAFAGIPPTKTCINCHSQVWAEAPLLEPVRESYLTNESLEWTRVHDLPDFVYFNHSIHVKKGVGCETCHGRVDQMPLMWKENTLLMEWCWNCHEQPEAHLRPRDEVFTMGWTPQEPQSDLGPKLAAEYKVQSKLDCSVCHR